MHLQEGELTLRDAERQDAETLCRWWNDGAVMAHAGFPNGLGTTAAEIEAQLAGESDGTRRRLLIEESGKPVGEMSYRNLGNRTVELGIKICEADRREKGLGTRCLRLLLGELFWRRGYEKAVLDTNLNNRRAQHVYEKLGFRRLRVNTDSWKDQLGRLQSSVDYELAREGFRAGDCAK